MSAGIQNDSATPSAAACAIADDANTIRRSTTCTPMKPEQRARQAAGQDRVLEDAPGWRTARASVAPRVGHARAPRCGADEAGVDVRERRARRASRRRSPRAPRRGRGRAAARGRRARGRPRPGGSPSRRPRRAWSRRRSISSSTSCSAAASSAAVGSSRKTRSASVRERARDQHALPLAARQIAQLAARQRGDAASSSAARARVPMERPPGRQRHVARRPAGPSARSRATEIGKIASSARLLRHVAQAQAGRALDARRRPAATARAPCGRTSICRRRWGR